MPLTSLDPMTALIVIDLQKGIVGLPTAHPTGEVVSLARSLAEAFRSHRLPVVLVNVNAGAPGRAEQGRRLTEFPAGWTELVAELNRQPEDHVVTKRTWGAFTGTDLEAYLRKQGVTQVVIAGVATSAGVESTARHAHELGFNVTLATDAMTDMNADAHANSITRIFPKLGETGTTRQIIDLLATTRKKASA
jgi:nicotinamidase-related amidase